MMLQDGGPCVGVRGLECNLGRSHAWYAGPRCKKCYEKFRNDSLKGKRQRGSSDEEGDCLSGGDNLLEVIKVSGSRYARPSPIRPRWPSSAHSLTPSGVCAGCRRSRRR